MNKINLIAFFLQEWMTNASAYARRLYHRQLYVTSQKTCRILTSHDGVTITPTAVRDLESTQEEADTRLFLHTSHAAAAGYQNIVVKSPDTDVAVLA